MDEQNTPTIVRAVETTVTSERVTKIEMRMETIEQGQTRIQTRQDRHEELLAALKDKTVATDQLTVAVTAKTEQHDKNIEKLQEQSVDVGKLLTKMDAQINMIRTIGFTVGSMLLGYIITNFHNLFR